MRHGLCGYLGFATKGRVENIRRIGEIAKLFMEAGVVVLTAFTFPFRADRERGMVEHGDFLDIYCDSQIEVCESRATKDLYKKARAVQIADFTGISSSYEATGNPEVTVNTGAEELDVCVQNVVGKMIFRGII